MFKIKDPKFYTLMTEIKELRDEKKEIDYEITELPWIASEIDDLKKEIVMINKKIPELIKQKNQCQKNQRNYRINLKKKIRINYKKTQSYWRIK